MAPLPSSATSLAPKAESAPGESATDALIGPSADHVLPPSAVAASGENTRSWLGRTATVSDLSPLAEATSPPLSATPGGVTSCHVRELAARSNTSQKAGSDDIGTTAQLYACVANEVAIETAARAPPPVPGADAGEAGEDEHATATPAASSASAVKTLGCGRPDQARVMTGSSSAAPSRRAARRTTTSSRRCRGRGRR